MNNLFALKSLGIVVAALSLAACSKGVEDFVSNDSLRASTLEQCLREGKSMDRGDCRTARQAEEQVQRAIVERREIERLARQQAELEQQRQADAERLANEERLNAIEQEKRAAFDAVEAKLAAFNAAFFQERVDAFKVALNSKDADQAAELVQHTPAGVFPFVQSAERAGGFEQAIIRRMAEQPAVFQFLRTFPAMDMSRGPTDFRLRTQHSVVQVDVELRSAPNARGQSVCSTFRYFVTIDEASQEPVFRFEPRHLNNFCF